nr:hypothetical protein Itr_chr14CG08040 [Ipomoea trifida]
MKIGLDANGVARPSLILDPHGVGVLSMYCISFHNSHQQRYLAFGSLFRSVTPQKPPAREMLSSFEGNRWREESQDCHDRNLQLGGDNQVRPHSERMYFDHMLVESRETGGYYTLGFSENMLGGKLSQPQLHEALTGNSLHLQFDRGCASLRVIGSSLSRMLC